MSYYASNQPYNRAHEQKDGLANGAIMGAAVGAAAMGGVHAFGMKGIASANQRQAAKFDSAMGEKIKIQASGDKAEMRKQYDEASKAKEAKVNKIGSRIERLDKMGGHLDKNLVSGGGWRKAAAYGASALLGMGAGAGLDAMNK